MVSTSANDDQRCTVFRNGGKPEIMEPDSSVSLDSTSFADPAHPPALRHPLFCFHQTAAPIPPDRIDHVEEAVRRTQQIEERLKRLDRIERATVLHEH